MRWDAEKADDYRQISVSLGEIARTIARDESDQPLEQLLLGMSSSYEKLAGYYRAREGTAVRANGETGDDHRASLGVRAIYMQLQEQWAALAVELDKFESTEACPSRQRPLTRPR